MEASIKRLKRIWYGMKNRCMSPKNPAYPTYGGRGIKVCDEWLNSLDKFIIWALSNGYSNELSLDRIDSNGNYEPSNCRWTTMKIQANNRRHYWLPNNYPEFSYEAPPNEQEDRQKRDNIKKLLTENSLTQVWLINRLEEEGLETDKTELSSVLSGCRKGAKAEAILSLSESILARYIDGMT